MALLKLKSAPIVLVEDDCNKNIIPLILELSQREKNNLNLFCYEHSVADWNHVFKDQRRVTYYEDFKPEFYDTYVSEKCSVIIESINQMALCLGWKKCLTFVKKLHKDTNVGQLVLILHKDCLPHSSKLQIHLHHIASAILTYDDKISYKVRVQLKKNGKLIQSQEILLYDNTTSTLKCESILKEDKNNVQPENPIPSNLSTFKIEVDQNDKVEKYKLKLPYMSKINEGESKVYYEPDAVDDWDEEDPDEDLDI